MRTRIHVCQSIRGASPNWSVDDYASAFRHADGRPVSPTEAKMALMDELAKGHEVLPYGPCEGFDFKTGCPGHRIPDEDEVKAGTEEMP